jgi:hypothetical protein
MFMPIQSKHIKLANDLSLVWDVESKRMLLVDSTNTVSAIFVPEKIINDAVISNTAKSHIQFRDKSSNPLGEPGDKRGDICFDTEDIFVCVEDYNGSTAIWKRADLTDI